MNTFENSDTPQMTHDVLRSYIGELMTSGVLDTEIVAETFGDIGKEIKSMYTTEVLNRSLYWHAYSQSSVQAGYESLPVSVENGIGRVLEDLIERKLKPLLRE